MRFRRKDEKLFPNVAPQTVTVLTKRILAVDDEPHIRRLIQANLERVGYEVIEARNGEEALNKVRNERPDMVILDVMMPVMDGFETLRQLKADESTRIIPVIMLTAKAQDVDVFRGWQSGVDMYLTKPFNPMELIKFVQRIFRSLEQDQSTETRFKI